MTLQTLTVEQRTNIYLTATHHNMRAHQAGAWCGTGGKAGEKQVNGIHVIAMNDSQTNGTKRTRATRVVGTLEIRGTECPKLLRKMASRLKDYTLNDKMNKGHTHQHHAAGPAKGEYKSGLECKIEKPT
jgi:hypothetical protein